MFVLLKVAPGVQNGNVVTFDDSQNLWVTANSSEQLIGIVNGTPDENSEVPIIFSGVAWVKASRDIPTQGGFMKVENAGVYTSQTSQFGLISPAPEGTTRPAGELVMVTL